VYGFNDAPTANRFMNDVNANDALQDARAKLFDRDKVRIVYKLEQSQQFDSTLSTLDDLAGQYGGVEIDA
jgi:hypothetical protein